MSAVPESVADERKGWTHRPALDGVRAVAVYLVVAFHAGIGVLGGGFVGVDVFFVLSGFLVGGILLDEVARTGALDLRRFYARRVRRLLPAAVVAILATATVFVVVAPLVRRLPLVGDAQAALLYVANWRFIGQSDDYFRTDVDRSPFLHFWSLSIEEQFYIAFPLVLLVLVAAGRRWAPAVPVGLAALFAGSLAAQVLLAADDVNRAYYGTDARAYQLLAGVLAAWWWQRSGRDALGRAAGPLACVGLAGVLVCSLDAVALSASVRGIAVTVAALALVLGAAEAGGADEARRHPLGAVLSCSPVSYLGRISYGTYLWHWPVVLVLLVLLDAPPAVVLVLTVVVATSLAALSYELVEMPVRTARSLRRRSLTTVAAGLTASTVVAVLVVPTVLESPARPALPSTASIGGAVGEPVPDGIDYAEYRTERGPDNIWCTQDEQERCVAHTGTSGLSVALVGDSQARMIAPLLLDLARAHDFTLSYSIVSACPWQRGVVNTLLDDQEQRECDASREDLYDTLLEDEDADVVLLAQQDRDTDQWLRRLQPVDGEQRTRTEAELAELNLATITSTLETLTATGADVLVMESIISPGPDGTDPLECLSAARTTAECVVEAPATYPASDAFVRTLAAGSPQVATFSVNPLMCPDAPLCQPVQDGLPVWLDQAHYAPRVLQTHGDRVWDVLVATGFFDAAR